MYDVVIIGAGPAGLTASIYLGRSKIKHLVIDMGMPGGQCAKTHFIENYPGFPNGLSGAELMQRFYDQAKRFGMEYKSGRIERIETIDGIKRLTVSGEIIEANAVIIATGRPPKPMNVKGEKEFFGRGVSYCGTCDGPFFKDKNIAVIGGGEIALQETDYLTNFASSATLIHRAKQFKSQPLFIDKVNENDKINVLLGHKLLSIEGGATIDHIIVENMDNHELSHIPVSGVFFFAGQKPSTDFCRGAIDMEDDGTLITGDGYETSMSGVFVAGDIIKKSAYQVTTAAADGTIVAGLVGEYLSKLKK